MRTSSRFIILSSDIAEPTYSSDCDCACAQALSPQIAAPLPPGVLVERHPQQQALVLDHIYQVVFVPSISRVAVVNAAALELLEHFSEARSLSDLPADASEAARLLLSLGLLRRQGSADPAPPDAEELVAWLHVTNACDLRCTYCYINKTDEAMSAETAFAAIDAIVRSAQLHGYRKIQLKFAGGEASLNLPLVDEIQRYAQQVTQGLGIILRGVVLSNGVGLTRRKLERIRDLGLRLMISLDGSQAFHDSQRPTVRGQGSFKAVVASIERACELGLDLTISVTVTGLSIAGLPEIVSWLLEHELHFSLNFYRENDCSASFAEMQLDEQRMIAGMRAAYQVIEQQLPRYSLLGCLLDRTNLRAAHQRACAVGEHYLVIDHRGGVAKCQMEIERPITHVWEHDPLGIIRLDLVGVQNMAVEQKEGCRDCQWRYWCAGGCPVATFRATGRFDVRSPNCAIYKALYPEVIRLEGLRLLQYAQQP